MQFLNEFDTVYCNIKIVGVNGFMFSHVSRTCEEIRATDSMDDPNGNNMYGIDPDQAGGVHPFDVECDFTTDPNMVKMLKKIEYQFIIVYLCVFVQCRSTRSTWLI